MRAVTAAPNIVRAEASDEHPAPVGWNLYGSMQPGAKPFGYIAAGDTKHPCYALVASMDRTRRPRNPRWHVVLRRLKGQH